MHPGLQRRLEEMSDFLRRGDIQALRLRPLLLSKPLEELVGRRGRLFTAFDAQDCDFGFRVTFSREVRPSPAHPRGRLVAGDFELLRLGEPVALVVSSCVGDADQHGPRRLADRCYPLAQRPFLPSSDLKRHVLALADRWGWQHTATDTIGYDRETRRFRRDTKPLPLAQAFSEMEEQGRQPHRSTVVFRGEDNGEALRAGFNRHGAVTLLYGSATQVVTEFIQPFVAHAARTADAYSLDLSPDPLRQMALRLTFPQPVFAGYDAMEEVCGALRRARGLNVTVIHLNPYLQAQVLDFLTGEAADLVVMDEMTAYLTPRSATSQRLAARAIASVFQYFGEARVDSVVGAD